MTARSERAPGGPLDGVRVVDLSVNVLGPVATQLLGDLGADVIKVETPSGDPNRDTGPYSNPGMAAMHMNVNRSKRSVTLNLKRPEAFEALLRLVDGADVFVHSMRPAAAARLGITYQAISARNPRIIYAFGPGYRQDGPRRDDPAYDDVVQGESGIASLMAQVIGEPRYFPTVIVDKFCGHALASAIGMALFYRERTGRGQEVQVPMYETMLSFNYLEHLWGAAFDPPKGHGVGYVRLLTTHRRPYKTKDGYICVLAVNDDQWQRLFPVLGRPELVKDPRFEKTAARVQHYDELYGIVSQQLVTRTTAEWRALLNKVEIPNGPLLSMQELLNDPYLTETGFFQRYEHPSEGGAIAPGFPTYFSQSPAGMRLPPPQLGEHNAEILGSLGYSEAEIAKLTGR